MSSRQTSGSASTEAATLFTATSWQPERELADRSNAPKATDRGPGGPQTTI